MERFPQNLGASSAHIDVGQICCVPDDVFVIILTKLWRKKRRSAHRNWTVAREIMEVESSHNSVTTDSKSLDGSSRVNRFSSHPGRCSSQRAFDLANEEERETAGTIVSRLHVELGHSDPRGVIDSLRRKQAHRLIIATAQKFSCSACQESQRRRLRPDAARIIYEPGTCLQVDQFEWRQPVLNLRVLGSIMVDAGNRAASVTIHRVMDNEHGLGNVTGEIMLSTLLDHWVKYYSKPDIARTDPEGVFRDQGFRRGLAAKSIRLDIDPGDASWKTGVLGKTLDTIKHSANRVARRTPDNVKSLMSALQLTMTYIETEDLLRGSCCWERHRQTSQFAKILIWLSAVSKLWTKLRSSASV